MKAISSAMHQRFITTVQHALTRMNNEDPETIHPGIEKLQQLYVAYSSHLETLHQLTAEYQAAHRKLRLDFRKQKGVFRAKQRKAKKCADKTGLACNTVIAPG
jgi:hypothetical protein